MRRAFAIRGSTGFFGLALLLSLFALGCRGKDASDERAVLAAIDALIASSADDLVSRKQLLSALEKTGVDTERGKAARDGCAEAYRQLVAGRELTISVQTSLKDPSVGAERIASDLKRAEDLVKESEQAMARCNTARAELRLGLR